MQIRHMLALGMLLLSAATVHAEDFFDPRIRANIGIGQLAYRDYGFDYYGEQTANFKANAFDLSGGFEFNQYLATELGVRVVRDTSKTYFYYDPVFLTSTNFEDRLNGSNFLNVSFLGTLPMGEIFSMYARLGVMKWEVDAEVIERDLDNGGSAVIYQFEDDGVDLFYGAGFGINVDSGLVRLEYQAAKLGDIKTSYLTLGVVWRFAAFN